MRREILTVITGAAATTGGIATLNLNILRALDKLSAGHEAALRVLCLHERSADKPDFLPARVEFRGFEGDKKALALAVLGSALKAGRRVMFFDHVTLALPVLPFAMAGLVRTVIVAHGSESWRRIRRTSRWSFRHAALTLANSDFTRRKMRECGVAGRIEACPLGLSPEAVLNAEIPAPAAGVMELEAADGVRRVLGARVLLLVGRMHPGEREKGHDELLDVWPVVVREFPEAQLVFAGPGEDGRRLAERARAEGVGGSVFVPGKVPQEALAGLYHRCLAHVMPSRQEGFGLVHLEAMNFGKACLGCRDDGAADVIVDGETGLLVDLKTDRQSLAAALRRLLGEPETAQSMGAAGFRRLHEKFTAGQVQERVRNFTAEVLPW